MGIQGRDDIGMRGEPRNGTAAGTTSESRGTTGYGTQTGRGFGWYERGRDDLRRRMEGNRSDRNFYYEQSGGYRGSEFDAYREPQQSYGGPYGRFEERGRSGAPGYYGGYPGPRWDERDERSMRESPPRSSHDRDAQAYGDYGHPGTGERWAYGDMGVAERREREGLLARHHRGALAERLRRWRKGGQIARDVMTRNPKTARPNDSLQQVAQLMIDEDTGIVPVVEEDNRLIGVITDRDIVCRLVARNIDLRSAKAADAMTDDVECVTEQHSLHDVLDLMSDHQVRRVPVVARGDRLVGIISMADIAREADVDEELQETFDDISSRRGFWARLR
jgi:CBS domain-containing protein